MGGMGWQKLCVLVLREGGFGRGRGVEGGVGVAGGGGAVEVA